MTTNKKPTMQPLPWDRWEFTNPTAPTTGTEVVLIDAEGIRFNREEEGFSVVYLWEEIESALTEVFGDDA